MAGERPGDVDPWAAFDYEVEMFHESRTLLDQSLGRRRGLRNAVLESALLHTRILAEALLCRSKLPDDVTLRDLVTARDDELNTLITVLNDAYGLPSAPGSPCWTLNKRLAHLTNKRGSSFDYGKLFAALDGPLRDVLRKVAVASQRHILLRYAGPGT